MTRWCKLLKGDMLITLSLCKIQLYRTITIAAASYKQRKEHRKKFRKVREKHKQLGCWTCPGSEERAGLQLGDSHTMGCMQIKGGCILLLTS